MSRAKYIVASDAIDDWKDDVLTGNPPVFFRIAEGGPLANIEIGPKQIALIGGAPAAGKTALLMQGVVDALRLRPTLRAVVCNVEMPPEVLLDRQLSRLSGIPLDDIRFRRLGAEHADRIDAGFATFDDFADRLCFVRPPFDLANVAATADAFAPLTGETELLLVLDYIQRIPPPGAHGDRRGEMDAAMSYLRRFADAGAALVVVSSIGRQKDKAGRSGYSPEALTLSAFKESGELEFGADNAFILTTDGDDDGRVLKHLKARHTAAEDVYLRFDGATQRFDADDESDAANWSGELAKLWNTTPPAEGEG